MTNPLYTHTSSVPTSMERFTLQELRAEFDLIEAGFDGALTSLLPVATDSVLGGVKPGSGDTIDGTGVISASAFTLYPLPVATASVLGGVKQGANVTIDGAGVLSATGALATLTDVSIPDATDHSLLYFDGASSLWKPTNVFDGGNF
jgi:hypothetical protein